MTSPTPPTTSPTVYPVSTHRLVLRPLQPSDTPMFVAYRNDPEVARYQDWDLPFPLAAAEKITSDCDWTVIERGAHRNMAIEVDGELAGDLYYHLSEHGGVAEVGWTLRTEFQGLGIASEAATALIDDLVFGHRAHRVMAQLSPENAACIALLERLGIPRESLAPKSFWCRGAWDDNLVHATTGEAWAARRVACTHPGY